MLSFKNLINISRKLDSLHTQGGILTRRLFLPDPIQGTIELPFWLMNIMDEPPVRRMMFIRQLGLKAYVDFPGAIHTRFSHALGTMQTAGTLVDLLFDKMKDKGRKKVAKNLERNKNNLMAAGFLHDIGHGPFSHVLDFILRKLYGKTHEQMAEDIIRNTLPSEIEDWGIAQNSIIQMIKANHNNPFLGEIINGPIDADKLDYLLRDAYHVGLRYSFDLDHFLRSFTVLGDENDLKQCTLGLDSTKKAIVTAELFIVIWKSMYDLVYHSEDSRIAEKMLEKAILQSKDEESIKKALQVGNFLELNDERLLSLIENAESNIGHLLAVKDTKKLYQIFFEEKFEQSRFEMTTKFLDKMENDPEELSEQLSLQLNESFDKEDYMLICDIVRSKAPGEIYLDESSEGEQIELRSKSKLIGAIGADNILKVYADPQLKDLKGRIKKTIKDLIRGN